MSNLARIDGALDAVKAARRKCPFHTHYVGHTVHAFGEACVVCKQRANGDGGRCIVDSAEHEAIKDIEAVLR